MLIDRDKAIEALGEEPEVWCDTVETLDEYSVGARNQWQRDVDAIKALPSAEQTERTGKWISYIDYDGYVECPFCESATNCESTEDAETLHYCFNCGARLEGVKNDRDSL